MTCPPRASNQKMPLTVNRFQPGTLSGLLATLNTARALPMEIATRYQLSSCSRFALQSATQKHQRHLSTPRVASPGWQQLKARKLFIIRLPEAGSGLIGDKPFFAAQRDAIARQIQEMGTQLFQAF